MFLSYKSVYFKKYNLLYFQYKKQDKLKIVNTFILVGVWNINDVKKYNRLSVLVIKKRNKIALWLDKINIRRYLETEH